ncbi:TPA: potassium transporter Kup [Stenotrophomonas maltophilia]
MRPSPSPSGPSLRGAGLSASGLAALGVVFGDIGTSPLYTLKTILGMSHSAGAATGTVALGVLSLIVWTLIIITSVKYVTLAMRITNDGEGGILALMSLLGIKKHNRPVIVALGLFGAALIYGDGAITPAISVLSALEGLKLVTADVEPYVLPAATVVLLGLFAIQPLGTAKIGRAFGPIMLLWFLAMAVLGIAGILRHPQVLQALNPLLGLQYLFSNGYTGFLILGGVFLCVTGAEALYADMGHFGAGPIRVAWSAVVLPSLLLNYAGQTALVVTGTPTTDNIFFRLCPDMLLVPFVALATLATIIASQSIITGAFSMTRQAMQLGWLPRLRVKQTSAHGHGQIYIGVVNWLLMAVTVTLILVFKKSDNLASAYGLAVATTMLLTSSLLAVAMRDIWGWGRLRTTLVAGFFLCIDMAFFLANFDKLVDGGYVPLLLAGVVFCLMLVWHRGAATVLAHVREQAIELDAFMRELQVQAVPRVPGTGVFLSRSDEGVPAVMAWHVRHNGALHQHLLVVNVVNESVPWVADSQRLQLQQLRPGYWHATTRFGFMEKPDVPAALQLATAQAPELALADATYYIGYLEVVPGESHQGPPRWQKGLFAFMARNSLHTADVLQLPKDNVVLIGRQVPV